MSVLLSMPPEKPFILAVLPLLENGSPGGSFLDVQKNSSLGYTLWLHVTHNVFHKEKRNPTAKSVCHLLLEKIFSLLQKVIKVHFAGFLFRNEKETVLHSMIHFKSLFSEVCFESFSVIRHPRKIYVYSISQNMNSNLAVLKYLVPVIKYLTKMRSLWHLWECSVPLLWGVHWVSVPGWWWWWGCRLASLTGVALCRELVPDNSPAGPPHGTAEPISGISREMYLREGTKC